MNIEGPFYKASEQLHNLLRINTKTLLSKLYHHDINSNKYLKEKDRVECEKFADTEFKNLPEEEKQDTMVQVSRFYNIMRNNSSVVPKNVEDFDKYFFTILKHTLPSNAKELSEEELSKITERILRIAAKCVQFRNQHLDFLDNFTQDRIQVEIDIDSIKIKSKNEVLNPGFHNKKEESYNYVIRIFDHFEFKNFLKEHLEKRLVICPSKRGHFLITRSMEK